MVSSFYFELGVVMNVTTMMVAAFAVVAVGIDVLAVFNYVRLLRKWPVK